jgi:hypothetical protein
MPYLSNAAYLGNLVYYMLCKMEPTDRCLRPPGDYYPTDGTRPEQRGGSGDLTAMPGDAPYNDSSAS